MLSNDTFNNMQDFLIPDPDIAWDLDRLETDAPTANPTPEPTPEPTLEPTQEPTPGPSPSPITSPPVELAIPVDTTVSQESGEEQESNEDLGESPAPTMFPSWFPTQTPATTYYSCPPPESRTVEARDANGSDVIIEIPPPISTVSIPYDFQVQLLQPRLNSIEEDEMEEMMEYLLPKIESRLGESLGAYMKSNTENADDEDHCGGYFIEDFRRRRKLSKLASKEERRRRSLVEEEVPTRIIGVASIGDLEIDETKVCYPRNDGCYVVRGEIDATYVGFNEAGVKSTVSRAVKEELNEGGDPTDSERPYNLNFLGTQDEAGAHAPTAEGGMFSKMLGQWQEVLPESSGDGFKPTPVGSAILACLGTAMCALLYILFVKSDVTEDVRNDVKNKMEERKEKKRSKSKALGESDDTEQDSVGVSPEYCYDLESVAIDDYGEASEDGVEMRSTRNFGAGLSQDGSRDSSKTRKISNKANEMNYADAHKLGSLIELSEDDESTATGTPQSDRTSLGPRQVSAANAGCSVRSSDNINPNQSYDPGLQGMLLQSLSNLSNADQAGVMQSLSNLYSDAASSVGTYMGGEGTNNARLVDRTPSLVTKPSADISPTSGAATTIFHLPSLSEGGLPPPIHDTPHIVAKRVQSTLSEESDQYEV